MRKLFYLVLAAFSTGLGCHNPDLKDYRVKEKDSANFSVLISMLYPKEHLLVKVNDTVLIDQIGRDTTGSPTSYEYFRYPGRIRKIQLTSWYNGKILFNKTFKDTLVDVPQKSVFISRPYPKRMKKGILNPNGYGYVPIDSSARTITLENDALYYKQFYRY